MVRTLELNVTDYNNPTLEFYEKCDHFNLYKDVQISKLQASCRSDLIECNYFVRATVEYDTFFCCVNNPVIDVPIIIYIPEIQRENFDMYKPLDWSPKLMPPAVINLPNAVEIGLVSRPPDIQIDQVENLGTEDQGDRIMTMEELLQRTDLKIIDTPQTQEIIFDLRLSKEILVPKDKPLTEKSEEDIKLAVKEEEK